MIKSFNVRLRDGTQVEPVLSVGRKVRFLSLLKAKFKLWKKVHKMDTEEFLEWAIPPQGVGDGKKTKG